MTKNLYVLRGGRDYYDVTVEELQEGCDILAGFYQGSSEFVESLVDPHSENEDARRIQAPRFVANYYETVAHIENLRQRIAKRKGMVE